MLVCKPFETAARGLVPKVTDAFTRTLVCKPFETQGRVHSAYGVMSPGVRDVIGDGGGVTVVGRLVSCEVRTTAQRGRTQC